MVRSPIGRYNLESKYPLGILLKGCEVAEMTVVQSTGGEETSQGPKGQGGVFLGAPQIVFKC